MTKGRNCFDDGSFDPRGFVLDVIGDLNSKRTGRPSCDAWIDRAIRQWLAFLTETKLIAERDQ